MNLQKAIENLIRLRNMGYIKLGKDFKDALSLGVEAIEQIQYLHEIGILHSTELLPSETKE